jgi:hypothetical protein
MAAWGATWPPLRTTGLVDTLSHSIGEQLPLFDQSSLEINLYLYNEIAYLPLGKGKNTEEHDETV